MLNYTFKPIGLMNLPEESWLRTSTGCLLILAGATKGHGRSKSPQAVAVKPAPGASDNMFTKPQL